MNQRSNSSSRKKRQSSLPPIEHARPATLTIATGTKFELTDHSTIGRTRSADIMLRGHTVARTHAFLTRRPDGEYQLDDSRSSPGTFVNGQRIASRILRNDDVIYFADERCEFHIAPPEPNPLNALATRVGANLNDPLVWDIARDELLEQGEAIGERMALNQATPSELGALCMTAIDLGALELEWHHGFIRKAIVRRLGPLHDARCSVHSFRFHVWKLVTWDLLFHPLSRLLQTLDVPSEHELSVVYDAPLPLLRKLRVGPFFAADEAQACARVIAKRAFQNAPRLQTPEVRRVDRASLVFADKHADDLLFPQEKHFDQCVVSWRSAPTGWLVRAVPTGARVRINGHAHNEAELLPGDVVEAGDTRFTFQAEEAPHFVK